MERRLASCPVRWQPRRPCLRLMSTDLSDPGTERNASHDQQQDLPTFDRACLRVRLSRKAAGERERRQAGSISMTAAAFGPWIHAVVAVRVWLWSFIRLWVVMIRRHSVRAADLPRR